MPSQSFHTSEYWSQFESELSPCFDDEDDATLWEVALNTIFMESRPAIEEYSGKDYLMAEIGRCSHWIRPHWRTRTGTAVPAGYSNVGQGHSYHSLPEFDWSIKFKYEPDSNRWETTSGQPSRRPLVHRITVPARTTRHPQATVHTLWTPGSPDDPHKKWTVAYAFERLNEEWRYFSSWDSRLEQ